MRGPPTGEPGSASCGRFAQTESPLALAGHAGPLGELGADRPDPVGRERVGTAAPLARQRADEAVRLEPRARAVQGAGAGTAPAHPLDVLRHRVPVLRALEEARHDVERMLREPAEI